MYIKRGHALEANRNNRTMVNQRNRNAFSIRQGKLLTRSMGSTNTGGQSHIRLSLADIKRSRRN